MRSVISVIESKFTGNTEFRSDSQRVTYVIRDCQLPHVGDEMDIFNEYWSATQKSAVIKCWLKISCLLESHCTLSREYLESTASFVYPKIQSFPDNTVDESTSTHIFGDVYGITSSGYSIPNLQLQKCYRT